jgi:hydrogenase expression/formation protein HypD
VSAITGTGIYKNIPGKYGLGCVISGFEPVDLLKAILMLVNQIETSNPKVEIAYTRVVKPEGNVKAQQMMEEVFELRDDWWRGLGVLPKSGLKIREKYTDFDAEVQIPVEVEKTREDKGCICGEILKGIKNPKDCKLFAKACTPNNPVGACMVSHEGSCNAYYRYNRD